MAEETLRYNIEINQEDLAAQLEQIRNQIDLSLGASAFAQDTPPSASSAVTLPQSGVFAAPDVSQQGFSDNLMANLDQASQFTQLGFTKFQEDARRIGLLANSSLPAYEQNIGLYGEGPGGFLNSLLATGLPGASGFDYDRSGMTRSEYRSRAMRNVADAFDPLQNEFFFAGLGATLGSIGGIGGTMAGAGIGGAVDIANQFISGRIRERESLERGFKQIAFQNFGGISSNDAQRMAETLQDRAYSFEGRALDYNIDTMQENLVGFSNAGGFSNVTSASEMEQVMEGVVDNARQFANNFRMKQEEAVQVMAQLSQNMIVDPSEMGDFSSRMNAFSAYTGMNPTDAVGFGMQGVQMTKGMGLAPEMSFNMAIEARMQAERLRRADPVTRQLVNDMGGAENFALSQMETGVRYMSSGAGLLSAGALLTGGDFSSTAGMLSAAGNFFSSDPLNTFRIQAELPDVISALGVGGMQGVQVTNAYNVADALGMTDSSGQIDQSAMIGLMTNLGMSPQAARSAIEGARDTKAQDPVDQVYKNFIAESQSELRERDYGIWGAVKGGAGAVWDTVFHTWADPIGEAFGIIGDTAEEGAEDFYDYMNDRSRVRGRDLSSLQRRILAGDLTDEQRARYEKLKKQVGRQSNKITREEWMSNLHWYQRDAMSGGYMEEKGFDDETAYELFGGLDLEEMTVLERTSLAPGSDFTSGDVRFLREAADVRDITVEEMDKKENKIYESLQSRNIDLMGPQTFMEEASQALSGKKFSNANREERKAIIEYYKNYSKEGEKYTTENARSLGDYALTSLRRQESAGEGLRDGRAAELAQNTRQNLISRLMGNPIGPGRGINMSKSKAQNLVEAMSKYAMDPSPGFMGIAKNYEELSAEDIRTAYSAEGENILDIGYLETMEIENDIQKRAEQIAANYGGTSKDITNLASIYEQSIKKLNITGGPDLLVDSKATAARISAMELNQAEKDALLKREVLQGVGNIVDKGGAKALSQLPEDLQQLFKQNNADHSYQTSMAIKGATTETGAFRVVIEEKP